MYPKRPRTQIWSREAGFTRSGFTITGRSSVVPYEIVQPTEQSLQTEFVQSVARPIHLFGFSISVAVGQTSMQAPQKSQSDSCT